MSSCEEEHEAKKKRTVRSWKILWNVSKFWNCCISELRRSWNDYWLFPPPRNSITEPLELFLNRLEQFSRLHINFLIKIPMIPRKIRDGNIADFEFLFKISKKYIILKTWNFFLRPSIDFKVFLEPLSMSLVYRKIN